jgi:thioredoxin 1
MQAVTGDNFAQEVKQSTVPVLVDFFATWCAPCRAMKPLMEELQSESGERYKVVSVDIEECSDLAAEYKISAIPTVVLFKNGEEATRLQGLHPKSRYVEAITSVVN